MPRRYTIILDPDDEGMGYTLTVPALPCCITQGPTIEPAIVYAREAISLWIEDRLAIGQEIPEEREPVQAVLVTVDDPVPAGAR